MAIIKCKMCGGDLNLNEGASTAECEFCGSVQTIPNLDDEKKLIQFERAERLRKQCEFDKAAGIYETIVADFRQEAEAYWGLVLCKYGIEYVDDPATGKKIPTCHRSSFDSIMEDSDFEQALENAAGTARKVYRDEAKAIEEIRKGIIAVSNNEKPYDIFICYKETDENGDRTLDSVLAQDVYDALTGKGYRVFFSRITLEDKLGMEYEPYIFAALNSAKIMLAFGTDYEYFNAVWVKNEWSRFLKLMAKDKEKHLIPCFKGIDAYDMPKEFARLQAQDLGKVGAIQDLLRGIEKIIPRQTAQPSIVQERVVVGGSGDNKIASLLDRGNMALEDGDWAKADSFFEDVLNNDSKNAQAYLGKTLAMEKCRTIDAFARKRKEASQDVRGEKLELQPDHAHINEMVERFSLPGYVEQSEIRKLYDFDLSYHSDVVERQSQYSNEESYWATHKWLSKAEKFAAGAVAENLQREKKALFAVLSDRVKKAQDAEAAASSSLEQRYAQHLRQADEKAETMFAASTKRREADYQKLLQIAKQSDVISKLDYAAEQFERLGNYQDSKNLAQHCRNRIAEEQAKLDKAEELRRIQAIKAAKELAAKQKKVFLISAIAVAVVAVFVVVLTTLIIPGTRYIEAEKQMLAGNNIEAAQLFEANGNFKDSKYKATQCRKLYKESVYAQAVSKKNAGFYAEALQLFKELDGFSDSKQQVAACEKLIADNVSEGIYQDAMQLFKNGSYEEAISTFETILDYKDSQNKILEVKQAMSDAQNEELYQEAEALLLAGHTKEAALVFGKIAGYRDAFTRSLDLRDPYFRNTLAPTASYAVAIKNDGTVISTLDSTTVIAQEMAQWRDVIDIQIGNGTIVALRSDGQVYVAGTNDDYDKAKQWTNIVQIVVAYKEVIGLQADGTLVSVGENDYSIDMLTGAYELHKSGNGLYAVMTDGYTKKTYGRKGISNIDSIAWDNLRSADRIRLCDDGTVSDSVLINGKKHSLANWKDIVSICSDNLYTLGVTKSGKVLQVGELGCNVSGWRNVVRVYAVTGYTTDHVMALTSDGTVLKASEGKASTYSPLQYDCSMLTDIRVPAN